MENLNPHVIQEVGHVDTKQSRNVSGIGVVHNCGKGINIVELNIM